MLERFRKRAAAPAEPVPASRNAVATLLVEVARADFEVDSSERTAIRRMLGAAYGLDAEAAGVLVAAAERDVEDSVSLYEFTRRLNEESSPKEKVEIIEMLWRVAFADGRLDKYEEHLVRKAADLLHVPHRRFIRAKLKVEGEPPASGGPSRAPARR
ncbi:MAG: TerB family tellurite resistance protein [Immundisolibacterales bacterium]|nr:TerB family tellurite resistance protein [Immundisolibacterales bacterium]